MVYPEVFLDYNGAHRARDWTIVGGFSLDVEAEAPLERFALSQKHKEIPTQRRLVPWT